MANRLSLEDFDGHAGCKHGIEDQAKAALRTWFTTPVGGLTPFTRLQTALNAAVPSVIWNATNVKRAIRAFIEDEPE